MILEAERCQLVLVDYQERLLPHIDQGPVVLAQAVLLAQAARAFGVPVHLTEQAPERLGPTAGALRTLCPQPLVKTSFDACVEGLLEQLTPATKPATGGNARSLPKHLRKAVPEVKAARDIVVLAGLEAHICVLQTAMGLVEQEIEVWLVTDASGACQSRQKDAALDRMASQGVELVTAEMVVYEWLGSSDHPQFEAALAWVKAARAVG
jgi:nicotinamidase-related amidase